MDPSNKGDGLVEFDGCFCSMNTLLILLTVFWPSLTLWLLSVAEIALVQWKKAWLDAGMLH
jgi:hypothetical protein